jgi:hypothetical protein
MLKLSAQLGDLGAGKQPPETEMTSIAQAAAGGREIAGIQKLRTPDPHQQRLGQACDARAAMGIRR